MKREYFECECFSEEHTITFTLDPDDGELYTSVFLRHWRPWPARVWIALKYVFGYKCKFGHWDTWILREEDSQRLADLLVEHKKARRVALPKNWKRPEYITDDLEHDMYIGPCCCGSQHVAADRSMRRRAGRSIYNNV